MRLVLRVPTHVEVDEEVVEVVADAENGSFGMLPRHVDFVAPLTAGILRYDTKDGEEVFFAVDGGLLVKCGTDVFVSTLRAVRGPRLEDLGQVLEESFRKRDERDRMAREAIDRLEARFVSRLSELGSHEER